MVADVTRAACRLFIVASCCVLLLAPRVAHADTFVSSGDASIRGSVDQSTWTLAAGGATLNLRAGGAYDFSVVQLTSPAGHAWTLGSAADTSVTVSGQALAFGQAAAGFAYHAASVLTDGPRLRLDISYDLQPAGLLVTRHYAVTSSSPTFETWTTFERTGRRSVRLNNLNAFAMTISAGRIRWVNGLQGDTSDTEHDTAFTLQNRTLNSGERMTAGSQTRSSEKTVPWFAVDGPSDELYAALLWSGAWSFTAERSDDRLSITLGLASMTTTVGVQAVEGPHVLLGVVRGGIWNASAALRAYVLDGLRQGRPLASLVTYNTWYAYGTRIDEDVMRGQMLRAAALGVELFVVDAGWYTGAGTNGFWDFDTGLGTWQADPARFPNGLEPLSDYAHSLGMKFGVWVEPGRVNLDTVGQPGLAQESWLATQKGQYGSDHSARICLAGTAGRQWVLNQLTHFIDTVHADYLKWDNNLWVNCDRTGHGHGAADGNFAEVNGFYSILATLRAQYPQLMIENAGGGGTRLDLGLLRYTDSAWIDDRTAPSVHVRHNVEGLSAVFPPAYLLSFVIDTDSEPLHRSSDISLFFRSRMMGGLGLSFKNEGFSDDELAAMQQQIETFVAHRDAQLEASGAMLTGQAKIANGPGWDAFQESTADRQHVLLWAFQNDPAVHTFTLKPTGLAAATVFEIRSADVGVIGMATGAELAAHGIEIPESSSSAAHLLVLTAQP